MSLQDFINKYLGVPCGNTKENFGQCVGLISLWMDNLGIPHEWGNAKDLLSNADTTKFDVIRNDPNNTNQFPLPGDIMVWDKSWGGGYGHTGVISSANGTSFDCFEQNNPGAPKINHHANYGGVLGWLHPKTSSVPMSKMTQAEEDAMRNRRDELFNENQDLKKTIITLNGKIEQQALAIAQDARDDHDLGLANLALETRINTFIEQLGLPQGTADQIALDKIKGLLKPIDEQVKPLQKYAEGLTKELPSLEKKRTSKKDKNLILRVGDFLKKLWQ